MTTSRAGRPSQAADQAPDGVHGAALLMCPAGRDAAGFREAIEAAYIKGRLDEQREPAARVWGHCPMGCGQTLWLTGGGRARCAADGCPNYDAVHELLADSESEHVVVLGEEGFTLRHPLRERLGDAPLSCGLHRRIASSGGGNHMPGRYRVTADGSGGWAWQQLSDAPRGTS